MTPHPGAPCPDLDRLLDAVVAGRPGAAERLDAHAAACPACAAEALLADEPDPVLDGALACLQGVECPPEVVAAAIAAARPTVHAAPRPDRAPDRAADRRPAAAPRRPVWRWMTASAIALVALVAAVALFQGGPDAPPSLVAQSSPDPRPRPEPAAPSVTEPSQTGTIAPTPPSALPPAAPSPGPAQRPATSAPAPAPVPDAALPVPAPDLVAAALPDPDPALAPSDTAAAREALALAFAIVGRAQQSADAAVSTGLQRLSTALEPARIL